MPAPAPASSKSVRPLGTLRSTLLPVVLVAEARPPQCTIVSQWRFVSCPVTVSSTRVSQLHFIRIVAGCAFENNCEVGVWSKLTNKYCLVGIGGQENFFSVFEAELAEHIPVVHASIAGCRVIGRMCAGTCQQPTANRNDSSICILCRVVNDSRMRTNTQNQRDTRKALLVFRKLQRSDRAKYYHGLRVAASY